MGKQGNRWKQGWEQDSSSSNYWGSSWYHGGQPQQKGTTSTATIIPYDQVQLDDGENAKDQEGVNGLAPGQTNVGAVQRALNQARKAEAKSKRVAQELSTAHLKWKQFQQDTKKAFLEQQAKYRADVSRLEGEVQASAQALRDSQQKVREAVLQDRAEAAGRQAVKEEYMDDGTWDGLIKEAASEEPGACADADVWGFLQKNAVQMSGQLGRQAPTAPTATPGEREELLRSQVRGLQNHITALQEQMMAGGQPVTPNSAMTSGLPHTPPHVRGPPSAGRLSGKGGLAMQPFYNGRNAVLMDPYQATHSNASIGPSTIPSGDDGGEPGHAPAPAKRSPKQGGIGPKGRVPIKEAHHGQNSRATTPPVSRDSLADRVQAKRDVLTAALPAAVMGAPDNIAIFDDDHDLEEAEDPSSVLNLELGKLE